MQVKVENVETVLRKIVTELFINFVFFFFFFILINFFSRLKTKIQNYFEKCLWFVWINFHLIQYSNVNLLKKNLQLKSE